MAEDNQMLKAIPRVEQIRVTARRESPQQRREPGQEHQDEQEAQDQQFEQREPDSETSPQWWRYRIELGRLLIEQKNLELQLYASLQEGDEEDELHADRVERRDRETRLRRITGRIAEIEQKVANLEWEESHTEPSPEKLAVKRQLKGLEELRDIYTEYLDLTHQETTAIIQGDLVVLRSFMDQKKHLLERVHILQDLLDMEMFKTRDEEDAKRVKARRVLDDIHSVMTRILDQENENSVELRNQKEEVRAELGKRNAGAKAISRYASALRHSRFVDTTK